MRVIDLSNISWRKSSYSNTDGGECLEVAAGIPSHIHVRDSKAPSHGTLFLGAPAWAAFVDGVKQGR
ncbi:DUF397 domain-containing protein [Streptomyces sp. NPDC007851]|uniref:DUF397 domain-containing protein n=1 Tax=Streptomyces sp. NPDC007851 TaxID=3155008 RepID=UPI0033FAC383